MIERLNATLAPRHNDVLLRTDGISKTYHLKNGIFGRSLALQAVNGVTLTLKAAQTLAVVGESGSGKSTLARMITMIERPTTGQLFLDGQDLSNPGKSLLKKFRPFVQMVFQNPYGSLNPRQKIGVLLAEPLKINTSLSAPERREKVEQMLQKVGLRPEHAQRYPHMFSGGQRQRIAIARALMLNPKIVVADEPVSALDVSVRAQVLNLMASLQQEFQLSYLFISHDLSVVKHIANDVAVLYLGKVVEHGPKEVIFQKPLHPYTQALLASTPSVDRPLHQARIVLKGEMPSPVNPPSGCTFHKRCPHATEMCTQVIPPLRPIGGRLVACHHVEKWL